MMACGQVSLVCTAQIHKSHLSQWTLQFEIKRDMSNLFNRDKKRGMYILRCQT